MKTKRCAFAAAVVLAGCTVAFLCRNQSVSEVKAGAASPVASVRAAAVPSAAVAALAAPPSNQTATVRGTKPYVLTCEGNFSKPLRLAAESLGARTVGVLSRKSLLVEADAVAISRLRSDRRFSVKSEFLPSDKIAPALAAAIAGGAETVDVTFVTLSPVDREIVQKRLASRGGEVLKGCLNAGDSFSARLPAGLVAELASCGDVRWMEQFVRPHLMNDKAVDPELMNVRPIWKTDENPGGLSGAGQVVSTSDSGIDTGDLATLHEDLRNRVKGIDVVEDCNATDSNGHGTHTAGSIVGDGTLSDGQIRGTAWGADLYAWFCGGEDGMIYTPDSYDKLFCHDGDWPAFIHSASWGSSKEGEYTARCSEMDKYLWEHPEFLPVYSAGNDGDHGSGTIGDPAAAKNVLTVGATQSSRPDHDGNWGNGDPAKTATFSSRGPCQDGRIKPDIAAPGVGILSTRSYEASYETYGVDSNTNYAYDSGTSMSCPLTAGAVALVREWLVSNPAAWTVEGKPEVPTAALMKAIVTGGAKGAPFPGNSQGWGRVDLAETLFPTNNRAVKLIDRIPFVHGDELAWIVETTEAAPLDVQLAWVDAPGVASADQSEPKLVNDLDLTVCPLDGDGLYYGNGGNSPDVRNNIESVRLSADEAGKGRYLVTVSCKDVVWDYTDGGAAALYIRGAFDPDEVVERYTVRVVKPSAEVKTYARLDKALNEAANGDVVEILDETELRESVVLTNDFALTLVSTNANPTATPVLRRRGADILVKNGSLLFTNVVFSTDLTTPVKVSEKGVVRVAGTVVFDDIVSGTPGILTDRPQGFELVGGLGNGITVECSGASQANDQFGVYTCSYEDATNAALRLVSTYGVKRSGFADGAGALRWKDDSVVVPEVAVAYVNGTEPVYYRTLDDLFDAHPNGTNVVIMKSGISLQKLRTLTGTQSISAANGASEKIVVYPEDSAGFVIGAGCSLRVSGIVFRGRGDRDDEGYRGNGLFVVNGAGAQLRVVDSEFRNIEGTNVWSGAIAVLKGKAIVRDSTFDNCRATGDHWVQKAMNRLWVNGGKSCGGAVYLKGSGCVLELDGGSVAGCRARTYGGGVYAGEGSEVRVRGALTVDGNWSGNNTAADNVHLERPTAVLKLSGELEGEDAVGVRYGTSSATDLKGNAVGSAFAAAGGVDHATAVASAKAFFNDTAPATTKAVVDGSVLRWAVRTTGDRSVPEDDPDKAVRVTKGGASKCYVRPEYAFGWIGANETATVEMLKDVDFGADLVVTNGAKVTLASANAAPYVLSRLADVHIRVLSKASLAVTNLTIDGMWVDSSGLVKVNGGTLELQSGAEVRNVYGKKDRASGAISVQNGGTFTMRSGAEVADCLNEYVHLGSNSGYGGGVLVEDHSTANLFGGRITGCSANRGGGIFVGTESEVFVSGDVAVSWNWNLDDEADNLCVADLSRLWLAGKLDDASSIGYNEGRSGDTEVFGKVAKGFSGSRAEMLASAHRFTHDFTRDVGLAVSDGTETLLVWGSALDADGKYDGHKLIEGGLVEVAVPWFEDDFTYDGTAQTCLEDGIGYRVLSGNVATNVGEYAVVVTNRSGFAWTGGLSGERRITWHIKPAGVVLEGVTFEDKTFVYDGTVKTLEITGTLPKGLNVTYRDNIRWQPGTNDVTACISGTLPNRGPVTVELHAKLIIVDPEGKYRGEPTPPGPLPTVVTNDPWAIAFESITRVAETNWTLVVTNRRELCWYRLLYTDDLAKGFTTTGSWEQATETGPWVTNVIFSAEDPKPACFWRAEGTWGTDEVPPVSPDLR